MLFFSIAYTCSAFSAVIAVLLFIRVSIARRGFDPITHRQCKVLGFACGVGHKSGCAALSNNNTDISGVVKGSAKWSSPIYV